MKRFYHAHLEEPGFIAARENTITDNLNILYESEPAGFDPVDGKYSLYCVEHGWSMAETNKARAKKSLASSDAWCPDCKALEETPIGSIRNLVPFRKKSPDAQLKELRFMAQLAKGNSEKVAMFEKVYGVTLEKVLDEDA